MCIVSLFKKYFYTIKLLYVVITRTYAHITLSQIELETSK